jgi:hypothetical protein
VLLGDDSILIRVKEMVQGAVQVNVLLVWNLLLATGYSLSQAVRPAHTLNRRFAFNQRNPWLVQSNTLSISVEDKLVQLEVRGKNQGPLQMDDRCEFAIANNSRVRKNKNSEAVPDVFTKVDHARCTL